MVREIGPENKVSLVAAAYRETGNGHMIGVFKSVRKDRIPPWYKKLTWYNEETKQHEPVWERWGKRIKLAGMAGQKGVTLRTHRTAGRCKSRLI